MTLETFYSKNLDIMLPMGLCFQVIKYNSTLILYTESRTRQQSLTKIPILSHENLEPWPLRSAPWPDKNETLLSFIPIQRTMTSVSRIKPKTNSFYFSHQLMSLSPIVLLCIVLLWFPIAAIINYDTDSVTWNNTHLVSYSSGSQKFEVHLGFSQHVSRAGFSLETLRQNLFPCPFPASRGCQPSLALGLLTSSSKALTQQLQNLSLTRTLPPPFIRPLVRGPIQIIQDNLTWKSLIWPYPQSPFCHVRPQSQVWDIRTWIA